VFTKNHIVAATLSLLIGTPVFADQADDYIIHGVTDAGTTHRIAVTVDDSTVVRIAHVSIGQQGTELEVSGKLQKRFFRRGQSAAIPGYLEIEIFGRDGEKLASTSNTYRLISATHLSRVRFTETLPVALVDVSSVRVTHHPTGLN
jgi:hypothetical protein